MTAPRTRIRASLLLAALFAGGLIAGAFHPTDQGPISTPPIDAANSRGGEP
ncbi:hypothetical protein M1M07_28920 [Rhodococcus sp. HM1]|uniref:hypothetical protein n=1 Tax=unclassified Rhodococcus (in: high G+C Gram-positive bacteria) TaxID=192944 RepID=UPI0018CFB849|nr:MULTISPECIES: hypothetical protein [unclassified Rhodococcus (in: high G+C Gram-positive bacteria)]MBH0119833.1 hypothetical protein [Rhodococcus sp. CX]MCK8675116.1 hypothetical protein [Rhodococcus sp. HM1]